MQQQVRLHHYISQSHEMMRRKQLRGDADLMKHRTQLYWRRMEWYNNRELDTSLRNLSASNEVCTSPPDDPEEPRPLTVDPTSHNLSWNTWDGLSVWVDALGGDVFNVTKGGRRHKSVAKKLNSSESSALLVTHEKSRRDLKKSDTTAN